MAPETTVDAHDGCAEWVDAGLQVAYLWDRFSAARDPLSQAGYLVDLSNAMSILKTWLPGWDVESGTMAWEREDDI